MNCEEFKKLWREGDILESEDVFKSLLEHINVCKDCRNYVEADDLVSKYLEGEEPKGVFTEAYKPLIGAGITHIENKNYKALMMVFDALVDFEDDKETEPWKTDSIRLMLFAEDRLCLDSEWELAFKIVEAGYKTWPTESFVMLEYAYYLTILNKDIEKGYIIFERITDKFDNAFDFFASAVKYFGEGNENKKVNYAYIAKKLHSFMKLDWAEALLLNAIDKGIQELPMPLYGESLDMLTDIYKCMEDFDKAEEFAKRSLSINSSSPVAILVLSHCYLRKGKFDLAKETIEILSKKFPENIEVKMELAKYFHAVGQPEKALELMFDCLKVGDFHAPFIHNGIALIYLSMKNIHKAIEHIDIASNMTKGDVESIEKNKIMIHEQKFGRLSVDAFVISPMKNFQTQHAVCSRLK